MKRILFGLAAITIAADAFAQTAAPPATTPSPAPTTSATPTSAVSDFRATPPPTNSISKFFAPPVHEEHLKNGVRVLIVERHELPLVALSITSNLGESDSADGVALLANDAATTATHAHFSWELAREFRGIGAAYAAESSLDGSRIYLHFLAPHLDRAMDLAAEIATNANFVDDYLSIQSVVRRDARHETSRLPAITLANDLFPDTHPFHDLGWGTDAGLARVHASDLDAFWKRAFTANHTTVIVVGDVKTDDAVAIAAKHFGSLSTSAEKDPAPAAHVDITPRRSVVIVDAPNVVQARIAVGTVALDRESPDYLALALLNNIFSSRVFVGTRAAHGYTYGMHSSLDVHRGSGFLLVQGAVELGNTAASLRDVFAAAANLSTLPVGDDELARAKARLQAGWASAFETNAATAAQISRLAQLALPMDEMVRRSRALAGLTPKDVLDAAQKYLMPKNLHVVLVGNAHDLTTEIAPLNLGPVDVHPAPPKLKDSKN
jgi:zinc protease